MINKSKMVGLMLVVIGIICMLVASNASAGTAKLDTAKFDLTGNALLGISPGPSFFMWYNGSDADRQANVTNPGTGLLVTDPLDVTGQYRYTFSASPAPEHTNWTGGDEPGWAIVFNYTAARAHTDDVVSLHLVLHNLLGADNAYFNEGVGYFVVFTNGSGPGVLVTAYNMDNLTYSLADNNITADISLTEGIHNALTNLTGNTYLALVVFGHGGNQTGTGVGQLDMRDSALYVHTASGGGNGAITTNEKTASTTDTTTFLYALIVVALIVGVALMFYKPKKATRTRKTTRTVKSTRTPKKHKKGAWVALRALDTQVATPGCE